MEILLIKVFLIISNMWHDRKCHFTLFYHTSFEIAAKFASGYKRTCVWIVDFVRHYGLPESREFARMESRKGSRAAYHSMWQIRWNVQYEDRKMKETGSYLLDVLFMEV